MWHVPICRFGKRWSKRKLFVVIVPDQKKKIQETQLESIIQSFKNLEYIDRAVVDSDPGKVVRFRGKCGVIGKGLRKQDSIVHVQHWPWRTRERLVPTGAQMWKNTERFILVSSLHIKKRLPPPPKKIPFLLKDKGCLGMSLCEPLMSVRFPECLLHFNRGVFVF